jgi:hypothetical protein
MGCRFEEAGCAVLSFSVNTCQTRFAYDGSEEFLRDDASVHRPTSSFELRKDCASPRAAELSQHAWQKHKSEDDPLLEFGTD